MTAAATGRPSCAVRYVRPGEVEGQVAVAFVAFSRIAHRSSADAVEGVVAVLGDRLRRPVSGR